MPHCWHDSEPDAGMEPPLRRRYCCCCNIRDTARYVTIRSLHGTFWEEPPNLHNMLVEYFPLADTICGVVHRPEP